MLSEFFQQRRRRILRKIFFKAGRPQIRAQPNGWSDVEMNLGIEMRLRYWDEPETTKLFVDIGISITNF
jgi:hypothetical protein